MSWRPREREEVDSDLPSLRVVLEHYGVRLSARNVQNVRCPLHEDRTPSCSVNLDRGVWKCHSCGEGGGVLHLIALKEGVPLGRARGVATALGLTEGSAGGGGSEVRGSVYAGRSAVPRSERNNKRSGGYVPAWRRR